MSNSYGIINEQGFPVNNTNMGFKPLTEDEKKAIEEALKKKEQKQELLKMSDQEKDDAFFQNIEFGTAGMRGILGLGTNRMNVYTVKKATIAFALYLLEKFPNAKEAGVVISHDNRHMSREFTLLSSKILNEMGLETYIFDSLRPTPELSFAVRELHTVGGIMITASHNPKEYNGYKVYDENGAQLVPEKIKRLLEIIDEIPDELSINVKVDEHPGHETVLSHVIDDKYVELVESIQIHPELSKDDFKVVFTPNHGTSYLNGMRVFKELGYHVIPVTSQCDPDPDFKGTLSPNPEDKRAFIEPIKVAKAHDADLIVMNDPDGDRCGLACKMPDGEYRLFTGNESGALLIHYIMSERQKMGTMPKKGIMYDTIVTSDLGRKIARSFDVEVKSFLTGFKYIGNQLHYDEIMPNRPTFLFGYEESYGCLIKPFVRDKDGLQAILLYSEMALFYKKQGMSIYDALIKVQKEYGYHYDFVDSLYFEGSEGAAMMKKLMDDLHYHAPRAINGIKIIRIDDYLLQKSFDLIDNREKPLGLDKSDVIKIFLADDSWIAVRPSGTEPKCKFYIEVVGDKDSLKEKAEGLYHSLKGILGIKA